MAEINVPTNAKNNCTACHSQHYFNINSTDYRSCKYLTDTIATVSNPHFSHLILIIMLTDRSIPILYRFSNFLIPASKSKLDIPKSPIRYDLCQAGGVGLGIFAALDRCGPVFVTGSAKSAVVGKCTRNGDQIHHMKMMMKNFIFSLRVEEDFEGFRGHGPEFLSFCNLCRMKLYGKDIYMYRGEKAFCSEECRAVQIAKDERKEEYRSLGVSGFVVVGANSCPASGRDQMHSAGIFAI